MTTPGGVPNLPVGALTIASLQSTTQDTSVEANKARAVDRMPDIFNSSNGGNPASDVSPSGLITSLFSGFNSVVAQADPADIQGPEDLPGLLVRFIEDLPVVGTFVGLWEAFQGTYDGDDGTLLAISEFFKEILHRDSPINAGNLFGLLDIPFVMLRNSNQELLINPHFDGDEAVGNRRRWTHVTDVTRRDSDEFGAERVECDGTEAPLVSNRGQVAKGQHVMGSINVLGDQVTFSPAGDYLMRLELRSYFKGNHVGTPVTVLLTQFTRDPSADGWFGAPPSARADQLTFEWTVPDGVDEVLLWVSPSADALSGRIWVDSASLQRGFNWDRVERDLQGIIGIWDGIADPDHWEAAYLGWQDLLSLVGIDTSTWVLPTALDFWREFNTHSSAMVRVFAGLGSVTAWEAAWDGLRGLATQFGVDTSEWPDDLDPGGLVVAFANLVAAGNAMFKDVFNKPRWDAAWAALRAFVDKLLGPGKITWPSLTPGGVVVDALDFVATLGGIGGDNGIFPKPSGGSGAPTGLKYSAQLNAGGSLPSGNVYYCVSAIVGGVETPASAEVMYYGAGLGTVGMKIALVWNAVPGATQYSIYRRIRSVFGDVASRRIGTISATAYTDSAARTAGVAASPPAGSVSQAAIGSAAAESIGSAQATAQASASSLAQIGDIFSGVPPSSPTDPVSQAIKDWWTAAWSPLAKVSQGTLRGSGSASDVRILEGKLGGSNQNAGALPKAYLDSMSADLEPGGDVVRDTATGGLRFVTPGKYSFIVSMQVKSSGTQYGITPLIYQASGGGVPMLAGTSYANQPFGTNLHPVIQVAGIITIVTPNSVYVPAVSVFASSIWEDLVLRGDAPASTFFMSAVRVK
ncbi:hypothetical protein [Mycolicibacter minnesotensis]